MSLSVHSETVAEFEACWGPRFTFEFKKGCIYISENGTTILSFSNPVDVENCAKAMRLIAEVAATK